MMNLHAADRILKLITSPHGRAKRRHAMMRYRSCAYIYAVAFAALAFTVPSSAARAQSADLALCDRLAADAADPDKPADVKGVAEIAPSDIATAIKFCKNAAAKSPRAMFELGRAYAANHQTGEAIAAWRKAAEKGSTSAMVELGVALATGDGVAKDEEQARALFERAAQGGNPRGVSNLAALASSIGGASTDPVRARALLEKGAATGSAEAQYQLGLMMADGVGGPKDEAAARALFEKAAAQNHAGALERMGAFAHEGRGGPKDDAAAKAYYEKAVALGDEAAKAALKRIECPYVLKDKRGQVVTNLCF
jgi:TPR repeat protein